MASSHRSIRRLFKLKYLYEMELVVMICSLRFSVFCGALFVHIFPIVYRNVALIAKIS